MIETRLERLAAAGIQLLPIDEFQRHFVFERDGFVSLVERRDSGFGNIGGAGLATAQGLAMLTSRRQGLFFVARGLEIPATDEQVELLRAFERDLRAALTD